MFKNAAKNKKGRQISDSRALLAPASGQQAKTCQIFEFIHWVLFSKKGFYKKKYSNFEQFKKIREEIVVLLKLRKY